MPERSCNLRARTRYGTARHGMARTHRAAARPPRSAPAAPCALRAGLRSTSAPRRFVRPRVPQPAAGAAPLPPQCGCLRLGRWPGAEGGGGVPGRHPGPRCGSATFAVPQHAHTHARTQTLRPHTGGRGAFWGRAAAALDAGPLPNAAGPRTSPVPGGDNRRGGRVERQRRGPPGTARGVTRLRNVGSSGIRRDPAGRRSPSPRCVT